MSSTARRLLWLQTFMRLERWKEEFLLVNEEMKRLCRWYSFHIEMASQKAHGAERGNSRYARGYFAVLCENVKNLKLDYEKLPEAIRRFNAPK
jgi:hypothetical protein